MNRHAFAAASLAAVALVFGAACLSSMIDNAQEANDYRLVPSAQAQPTPIRKLIEWLSGMTMPAGTGSCHPGRKVQYQLARVGDTIAAGAPIVMLIDLTDVYMTVFVGAADAAKLGLGDKARLILDAAPDYVIPATVGLVASGPPSSSKAAETKDQLAKEMLRVDLRRQRRPRKCRRRPLLRLPRKRRRLPRSSETQCPLLRARRFPLLHLRPPPLIRPPRRRPCPRGSGPRSQPVR